MDREKGWVWFRLPESKEKKMFLEGEGEETFHFVNFESTQKLQLKGAVLAFDSSREFSYSRRSIAKANTTKEAHAEAINSAKSQMATGALNKVVLSRVKHEHAENLAPLDIFNALCDQYPKAFCYALYHPTSGLWIGATPELLLKKDGQRYHTVALAGTKNRNADVDWTQKEFKEQSIVSDYINDALNTVGVQNIETSEVRDSINGPLVHLKTDIHFQTEMATEKVLQAIHPTPAVGGNPLDISLELIRELEAHDRSFYCGYLGLEQAKHSSYFVNLRCMQVHSDGCTLYAGGGITIDSDPDKEWDETTSKLAVVGKILKKINEKVQ